MKELENKSNNQLNLEKKQLELDYEALKVKMINDYDKLLEIEKIYSKINTILKNRKHG